MPTGGAAVFLDRDGVINEDRGYVSQWSEFKLLPGVHDGLKGLQALGFRLIIVTNQSGIGRGYYTEGDFAKLTTQMIDHFADHDIHFTAVYHCPHHPTEALGGYRQQCRCRKPAPGMIERAIGDWALDPTRCALVGDKLSDVAAGRSAGLSRLFQVTSGEACEGATGVPDLLAVPARLESLKP
ncbi:MAG: HAD family hydrolase [Cellvibrionales bacterium]